MLHIIIIVIIADHHLHTRHALHVCWVEAELLSFAPTSEVKQSVLRSQPSCSWWAALKRRGFNDLLSAILLNTDTHSVLSCCLSICTKCHSITFPELTTPTAKRSSLIGYVNTEMKDSVSSVSASGNGLACLKNVGMDKCLAPGHHLAFYVCFLLLFFVLALTYYFNAMPVK